MARKKYILLRDTPEYQKGAVFEEKCDDGTQNYICLTHDKEMFTNFEDWEYDRSVVEKSPKWFAPVTAWYVTAEQVKKLKAVLRRPFTPNEK